MKVRAFVVIVLVAIIVAGCSKIRLRKLTGYWDIVSWTLTDTSNVEQDGLVLFSSNIGDENIVSFIDENEVLFVSFENDDVLFAENGLWEEEDGYDYLVFADSIFLFNPNKKYSIDKLSKENLELSGTFVSGTDSFPNSTIVLKKR